MAATDKPTAQDWRRACGAALWSAFLAACLATMLFFALFDPLLLMRDDAPASWIADRRIGYTLGFFFFWSMSTLAAGLTAWLIFTRAATHSESDPHE